MVEVRVATFGSRSDRPALLDFSHPPTACRVICGSCGHVVRWKYSSAVACGGCRSTLITRGNKETVKQNGLWARQALRWIAVWTRDMPVGQSSPCGAPLSCRIGSAWRLLRLAAHRVPVDSVTGALHRVVVCSTTCTRPARRSGAMGPLVGASGRSVVSASSCVHTLSALLLVGACIRAGNHNPRKGIVIAQYS